MYCDESLIVRLKKNFVKTQLACSFKTILSTFFNSFLYCQIIFQPFLLKHEQLSTCYKALVITLQLCNSLGRKVSHMGFELELRFTYFTYLHYGQNIPKQSRNYWELLLSKSTKLWFMSGSSHIWSVLICVEYRNCCRTLDVYLFFAIWMGQIQSKLIYIFVTYGLTSL